MKEKPVNPNPVYQKTIIPLGKKSVRIDQNTIIFVDPKIPDEIAKAVFLKKLHTAYIQHDEISAEILEQTHKSIVLKNRQLKKDMIDEKRRDT